jgi:hypothetical protein
MAKQNIGIGSTGRSEYIYIIDSLSSTGLGKTGISFNTSGLNGHYIRNAGSATTISFASQTATGSWISGGWAEVDQIRMPGIYRVDLPDAIFSSGSDKAIVYIKGVSNTIPVTLEYQLTAANPNTFTEASIANTVWTSATRTLSATGISAFDIWNYADRTLTAASGATAYEIWNFNNRTLSATGLSAYDVWNYTDRIITGGTGVSLNQTFPENFEYMLITNTGRIYLNKADIQKIKT